MDPATGMVISSLIGGGISMLGGANLNRKNRKWQEGMQREAWARDDTAVQRRSEDLEAAGINKLIAGGGGGAAGNTGMGTPMTVNPAQGVGDIISNIPTATANIEKTKSETKEIDATLEHDIRSLDLNNRKTEQEIYN